MHSRADTYIFTQTHTYAHIDTHAQTHTHTHSSGYLAALSMPSTCKRTHFSVRMLTSTHRNFDAPHIHTHLEQLPGRLVHALKAEEAPKVEALVCVGVVGRRQLVHARLAGPVNIHALGSVCLASPSHCCVPAGRIEKEVCRRDLYGKFVRAFVGEGVCRGAHRRCCMCKCVFVCVHVCVCVALGRYAGCHACG